jgi:ATP-dependent DNA ligase
MKSAVSFVSPMLAKLVRTLPEGAEWEYEVKLDGYRLEAVKSGDKVRLYSRGAMSTAAAFIPCRPSRKSL